MHIFITTELCTKMVKMANSGICILPLKNRKKKPEREVYNKIKREVCTNPDLPKDGKKCLKYTT